MLFYGKTKRFCRNYQRTVKKELCTVVLLTASATALYGDNETRTRDLYVANVSLSQLSYIPIKTILIQIKDKSRKTLNRSSLNFSGFPIVARGGFEPSTPRV
jgi:hypothetical protein